MQTFIMRSVICLTLFFTFQIIADAAGVIDRTFGTNGTVTTPLTINPFGGESAFQPDGKFVVVTENEFSTALVLARFNENGSLDTSFGSGGMITYPDLIVIARAVEIQTDGKIVVAGYTVTNRSAFTTDFLVARFNSNGTFDTTFGINGIATINQGQSDEFTALAVQPDGKIVATGSTSDGGRRGAMIRFNANGTLDTNFADQGLFFYAFPNSSTESYNGFYDVKILPNGRIITGASFLRTNASWAGFAFRGYYLMMFDAGGRLVNDFGTQGIATDGRTQCCNFYYPGINFEIMPSGRIFLAFSGGVYVLNQNGNLYKQLPFEGSLTTLLADGRVLVLGDADDPAARVGGIKIYSEENFIGKSARAFINTRISAAPSGKILLMSWESGSNITFRRFSKITSQGTRIADYDRDDKTDLAFYRPGDQVFLARKSSTDTNFAGQEYLTRIVPEFTETRSPRNEIRRDGVTFWKNGLLYNIRASYGEFTQSGDYLNYGFWGLPDDIAVGGDFNGDGMSDLTVFRPSDGVWYSMRGAGGGYAFYHWGMNGDKPVPADYDYDGKTDYAIYRPATGTWWIHRSSNDSYFTIQFGVATDIPLTGDFDGDGYADFTVYRPGEGTWYQYLTTEGFRITNFGLPTDYPVPGDYDGDGRTDIAVYRNGNWYLLQSTDGFKLTFWGDNSQQNVMPVAVRYDQ